MKSCSELRHLEQFGIKTLTGEADALGYRILCDLDAQGCNVFKECFGMPRKMTPNGDNGGLSDNWNPGSIASVMLTGHEVVPLAIIGFYLQGHDVIVTKYKDGQEAVFALEDKEAVELDDSGDNFLFYNSADDFSAWPSSYGRIIKIIKQKTSDGCIVSGTRSVHQMSGRTG